MKRHPFRANGSEFADSAFSNIAATFFQCLSLIVSKLSTWEKNKTKKHEIQARPLGKTYQGISKNLLQIRWFQVLYFGGRGW